MFDNASVCPIDYLHVPGKDNLILYKGRTSGLYVGIMRGDERLTGVPIESTLLKVIESLPEEGMFNVKHTYSLRDGLYLVEIDTEGSNGFVALRLSHVNPHDHNHIDASAVMYLERKALFWLRKEIKKAQPRR